MPQTLTDSSFRRATAADALCLSALATQVFFDTYATGGINADLAHEVATQYGLPAFQARLGRPGIHITLAERQGHLVGFADLQTGSPCPVSGTEGPELLRLYVQAPFQRRGLGRALLALAEQQAQAQGAQAIWLTAWVGNTRALAFYPRMGYQAVGRTRYVFEGVGMRTRCLPRRLATGIELVFVSATRVC